MATKSPEAFRTISEVAEALDTPAHVLRFWESRFPQIRPVKRAGGRRYYRPADIALLSGIKHLLHEQGMTIRGVQKILREQGVKHLIALGGHDVDLEHGNDDPEAALEVALTESFGIPLGKTVQEVEPETATIIALETALRRAASAVDLERPVDSNPSLASDLQPDLPKTEENVWLQDEIPLIRGLFDDLDPSGDAAPGDAEIAAPDPVTKAVEDLTLARHAGTAPDLMSLVSMVRHLSPGQVTQKRGQLVSIVRRLQGIHGRMQQDLGQGPVHPGN